MQVCSERTHMDVEWGTCRRFCKACISKLYASCSGCCNKYTENFCQNNQWHCVPSLLPQTRRQALDPVISASRPRYADILTFISFRPDSRDTVHRHAPLYVRTLLPPGLAGVSRRRQPNFRKPVAIAPQRRCISVLDT